MAIAVNGETQLNYEMTGPSDRPVLILSNSLGTSIGMWEPQMKALEAHFRVLRYDTRGHGKSSIPQSSFSMPDLASDVIAIMDTAGVEQASFCGLSMGGMIGMSLASSSHAHRFDRFVFANTAARIGPPEVWDNRIATVSQSGMSAIVDGVLERWFSQQYLAGGAAQLLPVRDMLAQTNPQGYIGNCRAIRDADLHASLASVAAPVLVISGKHDLATTVSQGEEIANAIKNAQHITLDAAHLSNWEQPTRFNEALIGFLT